MIKFTPDSVVYIRGYVGRIIQLEVHGYFGDGHGLRVVLQDLSEYHNEITLERVKEHEIMYIGV